MWPCRAELGIPWDSGDLPDQPAQGGLKLQLHVVSAARNKPVLPNTGLGFSRAAGDLYKV